MVVKFISHAVESVYVEITLSLERGGSCEEIIEAFNGCEEIC